MIRSRKRKRFIMSLFMVIILVLGSNYNYAQTQSDESDITKAALGYIEGFYEGDTSKIINSIKPTLHKFGYWKNKESGKYEPDASMTFDQAVDYAKDVSEKKNFPEADAPKEVVVLNFTNKIAAAKITAGWGVDFVLLSKTDDKWMIEQVLWEGPSRTATPTEADKLAVTNAALDYVEGFYDGDALRLTESIKPNLFKFGYGVNKETGKYYEAGRMTFEQAIGYANRVKETKNFPKPDAPKIVEVIDILNHIALAKVTAWWGVDYILLSKTDDKWMIEQVLWAGILSKSVEALLVN